MTKGQIWEGGFSWHCFSACSSGLYTNFSLRWETQHLRDDDLDNGEAIGEMDGEEVEEEEVVVGMILHHLTMRRIPMEVTQLGVGDLASGVEPPLVQRRDMLLVRLEETELRPEKFLERVVAGLVVVEAGLQELEAVIGVIALRGVTVGVRALDMRVLDLALRLGDNFVALGCALGCISGEFRSWV